MEAPGDLFRNEETRKTKKLAEQAKDRERMQRILEEEKKKTTRREDANQHVGS
jgi:hypothetical protein